jgi:FkbM family methyltransferase
MLELLSANLTINWSMADVEVARQAAGAAVGRARLVIPRQRAANASLSSVEPAGQAEVVEVEVTTLDTLLPAGEPVHVLKLDVEGHESAVLAGARRVIAGSPDILVAMEWSQDQMRAAGYAPAALLALIAELGLTPCALCGDGGVGSPLAADQLLTQGYATVILRRAATAGA